MKCFRAIACLFVLCSAFAIGCSQESKKTTTTTTETPGGKTTVTNETTVDKTGDHRTDKPNNPPPANP